MEKLQEIRSILSSRVMFRDGAYMAAPKLHNLGFVGMYDGSKAASMFGVTSRSRRYEAESMDAAVLGMQKIFSKLGRPVRFESDPEQPARLVRMISNPVILTMDCEEDGLVISAYTARTILAFLTLKQAFRQLERHLPEDVRLSFMAMNLPKEPRETLRERRQRKKTEKWERKAQRYEVKAQKAGKKAEEK